MNYYFKLAVGGLDFEDESLCSRLMTELDLGVSSLWGQVMLDIEIEDSSVDAVLAAIAEVTSVGPEIEALYVDEDLVATSDLAEIFKRSEESIRLLVHGKRGPGGFPADAGVVGVGRQRVWRLSDVLDWFDRYKPDAEVHRPRPLPFKTVQISNGLLALGGSAQELQRILKAIRLAERPKVQQQSAVPACVDTRAEDDLTAPVQSVATANKMPGFQQAHSTDDTVAA